MLDQITYNQRKPFNGQSMNYTIDKLKYQIDRCIRLKDIENKRIVFKQSVEILSNFLSSEYSKSLDKLFVQDLCDVISLYIKTAIELKEFGALLSINQDIYQYSNDYQFCHLGISFFIDKNQLLDLVDDLIKTDVYNAKLCMVLYLFSFHDNQFIEPNKVQSILNKINVISKAFESLSYFHKGVICDDQNYSALYKELFYDHLLLSVINDLNYQGNTYPFQLISDLKRSCKLKCDVNENTKEIEKIKNTDTKVINEGLHHSNDIKKTIIHSYLLSNTETTMTQDVYQATNGKQISEEQVNNQSVSIQDRTGVQLSNEMVGENSLQRSQDNINGLNRHNRQNHFEAQLNNQGTSGETASTSISSEGNQTSNSTSEDKRLGTMFAKTDSEFNGVKKENVNTVTSSNTNESKLGIPINAFAVGVNSSHTNSNSIQNMSQDFSSSSTGTSSSINHSEGSLKGQSNQQHIQSGIQDRVSHSTLNLNQKTSNNESSDSNEIFQNNSNRNSETQATINRQGNNQSNEFASTSENSDRKSKVFKFDLTNSIKSSDGKDINIRKDHSETIRIEQIRKNNHQYFHSIEINHTITTDEKVKYTTFSILENEVQFVFQPDHSLVKRLTNKNLRMLFELTYITKKETQSTQIQSSYQINFRKFQEFISFIEAFNKIIGAIGLNESQIDEYEIKLEDCLKNCSGDNIDFETFKKSVGDLLEFYDNLCIDFNNCSNGLKSKFADLKNKALKLKQTIDLFESKVLSGDTSALSVINGEETSPFDIRLGKNMCLKQAFKHLLIVGMTGLGKSSTYIIPSIKSLTNQNAVVTDVDGDIYKKTESTLIKKGYSVIVLDLKDFEGDHIYNPFQFLTSDSEMQIRDFASAMILNCNEGTTPSGNLNHWQVKVKAFFKIITLLMIFETEHKDSKDKRFECLQNIIKGFESFNKQRVDKNVNVFLHFYENIHLDIFIQLKDECESKFQEQISKKQNVKKDKYTLDLHRIKRLLGAVLSISKDGKTRSNEENYESIKSVASAAITKLSNDNLLSVMTGQDTIINSLKEKDKKSVIFLRVDTQDIEHYSLIFTLFFQDLFRVTKQMNKPPKNGPNFSRPLFCFLDEFGNYKINNFSKEITTVRKFNIGMMCSVQSRHQIEENYGKIVLDDGFVTQIYLNLPITGSFATAISKASGKKIDVNGNYEPKISEHDLTCLSNDRACLLHAKTEPVIYDLKPLPKVTDDDQYDSNAEKSESIDDNLSTQIDSVTHNEMNGLSQASYFQEKSFHFIDDGVIEEMRNGLFDNTNHESDSKNSEIEMVLEAFYLTGMNSMFNQSLVNRSQSFDINLVHYKNNVLPKYTTSLEEIIKHRQIKGVASSNSGLIIANIVEFGQSCLDIKISPLDIISLDEWNKKLMLNHQLISKMFELFDDQEKSPKEIVNELMNTVNLTDVTFYRLLKISFLRLVYQFKSFKAGSLNKPFKNIQFPVLINVMKDFLTEFFTENQISMANEFNYSEVKHLDLSSDQIQQLKKALLDYNSMYSISMFFSLDLNGLNQNILVSHFTDLINHFGDKINKYFSDKNSGINSYDAFSLDQDWQSSVNAFISTVSVILNSGGKEKDYESVIHDYFTMQFFKFCLEKNNDLNKWFSKQYKLQNYEFDLTSELKCKKVQHLENKRLALTIIQRLPNDMIKTWDIQWCSKDVKIIDFSIQKNWAYSLENNYIKIRDTIISHYKEFSSVQFFYFIIVMYLLINSNALNRSDASK